ncbi:MAG: TolC family protein [Phenylobacterium sp.]|uniref:TolC family protein n=1 Tax=Phenylobacterium sp. TaxID=1871053 RepID=UPI0017A788AD|nr:TolC family protein [Phenylobacterium sp.]MBA4793639.1 TolC family protein [Phenylobacterium sp.]
MPFRLPAARLRGLSLILLTACPAATAAAQTAPVRLTEAQAIERALRDPDFSAGAAARIDAARAEARSITRFDNPSVSARRGEISGPAQDEVETEIGLVQPFDLAGRRSALRAAAGAEANAVEAEMTRKAQERRAEVRRAYAGCAVATETAALKRTLVSRLAAAERIVAARAGAGDTAVYDLRRVRVEGRSAAAEADLAEGEAASACTALESLTRTPGARPEGPPVPPAAAAVASALRSDLAAREQRLEAADFAVRAAERSRIPELEVGLGWRRLEVAGLEANGPQISVGATIPLFDRGSASVAAARARQKAEAAELALARRRIEAETAAAQARSDAVARALASSRSARDDAARLGQIAETAYEAGETGVTELVDAYRAAHDAELSTLELTGRAIQAAIELELAQGGPTP